MLTLSYLSIKVFDIILCMIGWRREEVWTWKITCFFLKKRDDMCINIFLSFCCVYFSINSIEFPLLSLMAHNQFSSGDRFMFSSSMKVSDINTCCFHSHILSKKCLSQENFRHQNFFFSLLLCCYSVPLLWCLIIPAQERLLSFTHLAADLNESTLSK